MRAIDRAVEAQHPEHVETIAKVQNPETDWQALNERNVAEHIRKRVEATQAVQKHGAGLAPEDSARPASRPEERAQLEREARLDHMDSGDVATPADIARQISPKYAHAEARLEAINVQLDRTRWNRGQCEQEAQAALYRIDERRQGMSWWEAIKNIGRTDPELAHWRDVHDRSVTGYHRAARQKRALEKEQRRASKDAHKIYDAVKADAVAELARRHQTAEVARERLRVLDASERAAEKHPIDRAAEREQRIIAGRDLQRQAREERLQQGDDFWQQTLAAGRMTRQAMANATTYEDVCRLNETAKLDRDKWGYYPLTVEDVAREISPTFADADARFKALTTKAENLDKAIENKVREQQGVKWRHDQRQEQMGGMQAVLDRWGPLRDRQLADTEREWHKLDKERSEIEQQRSRLGNDISTAEKTRSAELEKVREPAEQVLADRQQRAAAARETLAAHRAQELAIEREQQRERLQHRQRGHSLGMGR